MTTHPRTVSLLIARIGLGTLLLGFRVAGLWMASDLWGQAPGQKKQRVEEEEDTPKAPAPKKATKKPPRREEEEERPKTPPKRKVIRVEEEEDPRGKNAPARSEVPALGDLKELAQQARHPGIQELFRDLAIPHDRVVFKKIEHVTINNRPPQRHDDVEPIPVYMGTGPAKQSKGLKLRPLIGKPYSRSVMSIQHVQPYEMIAQERVRGFLKVGFDQLPVQNNKHLSHADMLTAAEQALSAVLRWHESARQTGQREGDEWATVESSLRKQLLDDILLKQLQGFAEAKDWDHVLRVTHRLAANYTSSRDRELIAGPAANMIKDALNDPTGSDEKKQEAHKRLHELELEFPDSRVFRPLSEGLREQAASLLRAAKELGKDKDKLPRVYALLSRAEETWPQLPGLRAYKIELSADHPVLRVGVRGSLPKHFSPAWACTDTEQRAVEMLFESLVKLIPDEAGIFHYRLGLAEYRPKVVPLGRRFQLPRDAKWSNGRRLDSGDIRSTLTLLKDGVGNGRSCAWGELLDKVEVTGDPFRMTLRLKQGYVDPLALMTFKILPRDQPVDSERFAENPVCSGPYLLDRSRASDEERRECVFFVANPDYGVRSSKHDLPRIQEIRFYVYKNPVDEILHGKIDLALDLTAEEADKLRQADRSRITVRLPSATTPNRRIYFLAVNQRKLPDAHLRKALAFAINREKLLNTHFRGPLTQAHKALNGPFPAGSWACAPASGSGRSKDSLDLFDRDKARGLSQQPSVKQVVAQGPLPLKYPEGDPALTEALKELCAQVKETTGIVLELVPCDPCRLREDVERTQSYTLAYYHYDFPDETYWLWPLLGQSGRANADSRNYLNLTDKDIQEPLRLAMVHRDFAKVREYFRGIDGALLNKMPLIPLWQLDPLLAYTQDIKPAALDPTSVFTNIEEWRLQRK